jgi:HAD superfamily hydrolase (TIGR01490 family)
MIKAPEIADKNPIPKEIPVTPQRRAALFDFDGTLIRGDSQAMEVTRRLRHQRLPALLALRLIPTMILGLLAGPGLVSQHAQNQAYLRTYRGSKAVDLVKQGEALFQKKIRRAFMPQILNIMAAHRRAGDAIVIASASPHHILAPAAAYLKPDFLICTRLETDPLGRCTGRPLGAICIGAEKAKQIRDLAACHYLDLAAGHAYSDHHADLQMLTSVGQPHVVNPSKPLKITACKHGWPIHYF